MTKCFNNLCSLFSDSEKFYIENSESFSVSIRPNFVLRDNAIEVTNFPIAFANRENKKNRIYLKEVLYSAYEFYKGLIKEQGVFRYMFDGHQDGDDYSKVIGYIKDIKQSEEDLGIYADFFILLSNPSGRIIKDILFDLKGDIGVSMRIFVSDSEEVPRPLVKEKYPYVVLIDEQYDNLGKLFALSPKVDIQRGTGYLQRIDIVSMPSDNYASASRNLKESYSFNTKSLKVKSLYNYNSMVESRLSELDKQTNIITDTLSIDYKLFFLLKSYKIDRMISKGEVNKNKYKKDFYNLFSDKNQLIKLLNTNQFLIENSLIIFDIFEDDILKKFPNAKSAIINKTPAYLILIKFFSEKPVN